VEFLVNDLSLYGQFQDFQTFQEAIDRLMNMRAVARKFGREIFCNRKVAFANVTPAMAFTQIIQNFDRAKKNSIMQWLTKNGPFWEDERMHGPDDYLMCLDEIVTDSAVGEAAWCSLNGIDRHVVSFSPSQWERNPLQVIFFEDEEVTKSVDVANFWVLSAFKAFIEKSPPQIDSWHQLGEAAVHRFPQLVFAGDAFMHLEGHPFVPGAAHRLMFLLHTLDRFCVCFDEQGKRTAEGHEIYNNFFTGKKGEGGKGALFTDSSDDEKNKFKAEMTFEHPGFPGEFLFCPWHGKIQTPQLRVHFSWPVKAGVPLYIVYIGPKITKR
jgi:hypothetical protein